MNVPVFQTASMKVLYIYYTTPGKKKKKKKMESQALEDIHSVILFCRTKADHRYATKLKSFNKWQEMGFTYRKAKWKPSLTSKQKKNKVAMG